MRVAVDSRISCTVLMRDFDETHDEMDYACLHQSKSNKKKKFRTNAVDTRYRCIEYSVHGIQALSSRRRLHRKRKLYPMEAVGIARTNEIKNKRETRFRNLLKNK